MVQKEFISLADTDSKIVKYYKFVDNANRIY